MEKKISVKDLLMQAFLTGWELSDKSIAQDEYLQSAIQVIEVLQVEPENVYAEEGLGLTDGDEVDHLDDLLRADGQEKLLMMGAGPWKTASCMSAYCVNAQKMADQVGMRCWENDGKIRYFSLILF